MGSGNSRIQEVKRSNQSEVVSVSCAAEDLGPGDWERVASDAGATETIILLGDHRNM